MSARPQAQCGACARYRSPLSPENTTGLRRPFCAAFPTGIPDDIWHNRLDHRQSIEGDHGLQWISRDGAKFPTYAFAAPVLDTDAMASPMIAAGGEARYSGAMIALVPSAEHAARLAVEGGELVDDLHATLIYLGDDADAIEQDVRDDLAAWARALAGQWSSVEADAFAPSLFNPTGEDPCAVLVLSGADLAEFHETALADVGEIYDFPAQRQPWCAHITLLYRDVHEARNAGAGAAEDGDEDSSTRIAAGSMSDHRFDAVETTSTGLDSAQLSGQRDSSGGSGDSGATDRGDRGRAPHVRHAEMRQAGSSQSGVGGRSLSAPRDAPVSGDVLKASGALRSAQFSGVGDLHGVQSREFSAISGASTNLAGLMLQLMNRTGPVVFDRIRLAFAGEIIDVPLGNFAEIEPAPVDDPQPVAEPVDDEPPVAVVASAREAWDGCPRCFAPVHTGVCPPAL